MEGIVVVAYLVTCSPNMLACQDLSTTGLEWRHPAPCEAALPGLKHKYVRLGFRNIMAKCHYLMKDGARVPIG